MTFWLPPLALLLDLLFADPARIPHPVRGIALLADALEAPARRLPHPVLVGVLVMLALLAVIGSCAATLLRLPFGLGAIAAIWLAWSGLALGGLVRECTIALAAVRDAEANPEMLPKARQAVQMLVSRDTSAMQTPDLYRSLAESAGENFNDAFVAPWFWLCLGGPVALWLYKTASTMDSMWGYKTECWRSLGWASARLDDVLAFIPARLSALFLWLPVWLRGLPASPRALVRLAREKRLLHVQGWPGFAVVRQHALRSDSPNAGWPMAASAWLFQGRAGGPTAYHGNVVQKPLMGPEHGVWRHGNTAALISHLRVAGLTGGALSFAVILGISLL